MIFWNSMILYLQYIYSIYILYYFILIGFLRTSKLYLLCFRFYTFNFICTIQGHEAPQQMWGLVIQWFQPHKLNKWYVVSGETKLTPPKTKMPMKKTTIWRCISLLKPWWFFHVHSSQCAPWKSGPKKGKETSHRFWKDVFFVGIVGKWKCFAHFLFGCCPLGETCPSQYIIFHSDHQDCGILDRLAWQKKRPKRWTT